ncbi:MAG: DUF1285 domain-containing protein [Hyphomicrobiales bacterium]
MTDILAKLADKIGDYENVGHAPVERWSPEYCGELDIQIKANGEWLYMGSAIKRQKLVKLFTTVLWRDVENSKAHNDGHYLVTPVEKIKIKVEDAAFLAIDMLVTDQADQQILAFQTNLAGKIIVGKEHPIRFVHDDGQFMAYIAIRYGLEAKLTRALCYQLADYMQETDDGFVLISDKQQFTV